MKPRKLIIMVLVLVVGVSHLIAEPMSTKKCCKPKPVGGMQALTRNAEYPVFAIENRYEGNVTVNFRVDEFGNVSQINIVGESGSLFGASAIEAVQSTNWAPAEQNGSPVAVNYSVPFEFRIN
jgi:TonB family protein